MNLKPVIFFLLTFSILFCSCNNTDANESTPKGHLFIIGGNDQGHSLESVVPRFIELADGFNHGKIVVIPMASGDPSGTGSYQASQMKELGAKNVSFLVVSKEEANQDSFVNKLNGVTGIFFSGGLQVRLMNTLGGTLFAEKIYQLYRDGATIGGTSAGAAVMSEIMITGNEVRPDKESDMKYNRIEGANIVNQKGFGFLKNVIIDQHFLLRKRNNRLISLVLEHPDLVGIGIDELTAIIVYPDQTFEVIGKSSVIFYDARQAEVAKFDSTQTYNLAASNIKMHILTEGYKINLSTNKIISPDYEK